MLVDQPAVQISGLSKRFGRVLALSNIDVSIPSGLVCGVVGPNGSGKTTLFAISAGFLRPSSGSISVLGQVPSPGPGIASLIGEPNLWPHLTVEQNAVAAQAALCGRRERSDLDALLTLAGFDDRSLRRRRYSTCSTGMKQRLAVALTLLSDPDFILLDEPTNGLDPQGIVGVRQLMRSLLRRSDGSQRTVLLASHLLSEVEKSADYLLALEHGQVRYCGPLEGFSYGGIRLFTRDQAEAKRVLASAGLLAGLPDASGPPMLRRRDDLGEANRVLALHGIFVEQIENVGDLESSLLSDREV